MPEIKSTACSYSLFSVKLAARVSSSVTCSRVWLAPFKYAYGVLCCKFWPWFRPCVYSSESNSRSLQVFLNVSTICTSLTAELCIVPYGITFGGRPGNLYSSVYIFNRFKLLSYGLSSSMAPKPGPPPLLLHLDSLTAWN